MKTQSLQIKVLLLVAGAMAVSLFVSILALSRVYGSIQELDRISREDFETQQAILRATVAFKQQVQEWKNVLLRGSDAAQLESYWQAFLKQEKQVANSAREARSGTPHDSVRTRLDTFIASHKAAGEGYRKGLEAFKESKFDPHAGDKAVAGIDRAPTTMLIDVEKEATDFGAKATLDAVQRADSGYRLAIAGTVAVMLIALVALWFFFRRAVLAPMGRRRKRSSPLRARSLPAPRTCRSAPRSRPPASSRPRPAWRSSRAP